MLSKSAKRAIVKIKDEERREGSQCKIVMAICKCVVIIAFFNKYCFNYAAT